MNISKTDAHKLDSSTYVGPYAFSTKPANPDDLREFFVLCFGVDYLYYYENFCQRYKIEDKQERKEVQNQK